MLPVSPSIMKRMSAPAGDFASGYSGSMVVFIARLHRVTSRGSERAGRSVEDRFQDRGRLPIVIISLLVAAAAMRAALIPYSDRDSHYTTDHGEVKLLSPGLGRDDSQRVRAACCAAGRALPGCATLFTRRSSANATVLEFVSQYVDLKPTASGAVGLCPFHDDHHPSFGIDVEGNYWHLCWLR